MTDPKTEIDTQIVNLRLVQAQLTDIITRLADTADQVDVGHARKRIDDAIHYIGRLHHNPRCRWKEDMEAGAIG